MTIADAAEAYLADLRVRGSKSASTYADTLRPDGPVVGQVGPLDCRSLRREDVLALLRWWELSGYAERTRGRLLSGLANVLEHAHRLGAVDELVCRSLPRGSRPRKRSRDEQRSTVEVLTAAEVGRLLAAEGLAVERRLAYALALFTGARLGELVELRWSDVVQRQPLDELTIARSWSRRDGQVRSTKTDDIRRVPVHPSLRTWLSRVRAWFSRAFGRAPGGGDLVAPYRAGSATRWHETTLLRAWHRDLLTVGIEHPSSGPRRFHATRHTFCSALLEAGAQERVIEAMTHRPSKVGSTSLPVYLHASHAAKCEAILLLPYGTPGRLNTATG